MYAPYGFMALTGQNAASTQAKNMQPSMPGYTGLDSMKFDQMRTPEDQIHWLYLYASTLDTNSLDVEQAQAMIDASAAALKSYSDDQDDGIKEDVATKYNYLLGLITQLAEFPGTVFDPTYGNIRPIKIVCERIYDFDRIFASPAGEYDAKELTAAGYDALGVEAREYDVAFTLITYEEEQ